MTSLPLRRPPATIRFPQLGPEGDDRLTLRACYEKHLRPVLADRAEATRSAYRTTIRRHWEPLTGDPAVGDIDDGVLQAWWAEMRRRDYGDSLLRKQYSNVRRILRRLGPRAPGNPAGLGVIAFVPYLEPPPPVRRRKRVATLDDLDRLYIACGVATWPHDGPLPPPLLWRCLLVLAYNLGPRTGDLLGLPWSAITWSADCPDPDVPRRNASGWICFEPQKTRRKKGELLLPLNATVRRHLQALAAVRSPAVYGTLFPHGRPNDWHLQRRRIAATAGLGGGYTFQQLRATCSTAWNRQSYGLGRHVLGHSPRGVNEASYLSAVDLLLDHVEQLRQPAAFRNGPQDIVRHNATDQL